jgi:hypothetical protein
MSTVMGGVLKKYSVTLMGKTYFFVSDDSEHLVKAAIEHIVNSIDKASKQFEKKPSHQCMQVAEIFLLAAIEIAYELRVEEQNSHLQLERLETIMNEGIATLVE